MSLEAAAPHVLSHKLETLHSDVGEIKAALRDLTQAVTRLALVEERQAQSSAALDRAFRALERVEQRIAALELQTPDRLDQRLINLEQQAPTANRTAAWVDRAVWGAAAAAVMYVAKSAGLLN